MSLRWGTRQFREELQAVQGDHRALWLDHVRRCGCHDAWNQCPCSESGVHPEGCGCCQWCE